MENNDSETGQENSEKTLEQKAEELFGSNSIDLPEPNPGVDDFIAAQPTQEPKDGSLTDKKGNPFDPGKHATEDDGSPKYKKNGEFAKKRGRKSGEKSQPESSGDSENRDAELKFSAQIIVGSIDSVTNTLLAIAASEPEKETLIQGWVAYLKTKDLEEIPPGYMLALTYLAIYGTKLREEEPQKRVSRFRYWIGEKYKGLQRFFNRKRKVKKAQPESGTENNQ